MALFARLRHPKRPVLLVGSMPFGFWGLLGDEAGILAVNKFTRGPGAESRTRRAHDTS
jgi:hypothetical protein